MRRKGLGWLGEARGVERCDIIFMFIDGSMDTAGSVHDFEVVFDRRTMRNTLFARARRHQVRSNTGHAEPLARQREEVL